MARHDDRHRVGAERVADGAGGPRMTDAPREVGVRRDLAERNAIGLAEHAALELADAGQVDRHGEERAAATQILGELVPRLLSVPAPAPGGDVPSTPVQQARDAALARLDVEAVDQGLERARLLAQRGLEPAAEPDR